MRLYWFVAAIGYLLLAAPAAVAEQTFPYKAYVVADDVYVRSGPGRTYYPTGRLSAGNVVEVYRHDPGGWYAIRPPEGSFEWVSARYLELAEDGLAKITAEGVAARVGSDLSDIRDVIQVRLHEGELVEVLEAADFRSGADSGRWYKIAPPSGSFRWVHAKYLDLDPAGQGIRKVSARSHPLTDPSANRPDADGADSPDQSRVEPTRLETGGSPDVAAQGAEHWEPVSSQVVESIQQRPVRTDRDPARHTNQFTSRADDPNGELTERRISPEEYQAELDKINADLSAMLVEEPTVWALDELATHAEMLFNQAATAVERGRARLLVKRLEQSQSIKERYFAINEMESDLQRHERQLASTDRRGSMPRASASEPRFDGTGTLRRVVSMTLGSPQYALVDGAGNVECYVTPAPGVNMQYYLGREIGVTGIRGYIPDRKAQHVTAKHVTPLEDRPVLR